jgi:hypothetical protein
MGLLSRVLRIFAPQRPDARSSRVPGMIGQGAGPSAGAGDIVEIPVPGAVRLRYSAQPDGRPDAGEVVWGWVPFQEDPTQGKDRPLLLLAAASDGRMLAMKLTSRAPDRADAAIGIGSGPWDRAGRPSWLDVDQAYLVPRDGVRREGAAVSPETFERVALELAERLGWTVE